MKKSNFAEGWARKNARRWLAASALVASTAVATKAAPPQPQQAPNQPEEGQAGRIAGSAATFLFEIPAAPLGSVLEDFERITGWDISLVDEQISGLQSPGVSAQYSGEGALSRL